MCDCAAPEDLGDASTNAITIFEKLASLAIQYAKWTNEALDNPAISNAKKEEIASVRRDAHYDDVCPTNSSSSKSSTDSARVYEFVNQWELKCKCDVDGEGEEFEDERSCDRDDVDKYDDETPDVECTLAIIKPEAVANRRAIEDRIEDAGFSIQQTSFIRMTSEQVSEFYVDSYGKADFPHLVSYIASGPIVVHVLEKKNAVREWRTLMGPAKVVDARLYFPDSIRARYGRKGQDHQNAVHGSATREEAEREIHFFFPDFIIEPLPKWKKAEHYLAEVINKVLANGLALRPRQRDVSHNYRQTHRVEARQGCSHVSSENSRLLGSFCGEELVGAELGLYHGDGIFTGLLDDGQSSAATPETGIFDRATPRRAAKPTGSTLATLTSHGSAMDSSTFCV